LLPTGRGWSWVRGTLRVPNARFALGVVLVVALGIAWVAVRQPSSRGAAPLERATADSSATTAATTTTAPHPPPPVVHVVAVPPWVPRAIAATCRARASAPANVVVDCTPGRGVIRLQYRRFSSVTALRNAYAAGAAVRGGVGPSTCAAGSADERSWSVAASPRVPAGRYRCELVGRRARIVWSNERVAVLGTAGRADADLRSLYQWWTTVPGPTTSTD
jgi:hypothetical protein